MKSCEIAKGVYWVGAVDWNARSFHGHTYTTARGTTYNAYLIVDEKIALIDTVYGPFTLELLEKVKEIVPLEKIDYIVANHVETDHSGALPAVMKLCPKAKIYGTAKCKTGLHKHYYADWDFQIVKTGDILELGGKTLTFIEAPMIHWPDSMFTYLIEDQILMSNDAFGQHIATAERFNDQVDACAIMDEAEKYFANILWPFCSLIIRKIEEVIKLNIPIKIIAPSHGIIWRTDPLKIVYLYMEWSKQITKKKAVIVYESMYGSTSKMALEIAAGLTDCAVSVKLYDIAQSDRTEVIKDMLDAKAFVIGSSTHDNDMLPSISGFLELIKGLKAKNRIGAAFGSYGWGGGAIAEIENVLKESGIDVVPQNISVQFVPDINELKSCYEFGKTLGSLI